MSPHGDETSLRRIRLPVKPGQAPLRAAPCARAACDAIRDNLSGYQSLCHDCGFDLLVTPAAELARSQFPGAPEGSVIMQFTTRCAMCRGTMTVEARP